MGGGLELGMPLVRALKAGTVRAAAVRIADHVASEHPHPDDDRAPRIAGAAIAKDPAVRREVTELLDQLGLLPTHRRAS